MTHCPFCGASVGENTVRDRNLSALGYKHEDERHDCPECGETFVYGIPKGEHDTDKWTCDSCEEGAYIPHFLFINLSDETVRTRPKCSECYHVPRERIELLSKFNGENVRAFVGHIWTTGDRDVDSDPI